jgi:hypothetical protein
LRLDYPEPKYQSFHEIPNFSFEYNGYAKVSKTTNQSITKLFIKT